MKNLLFISFLLLFVSLGCGKDKKTSTGAELKEEIQLIESETQKLQDIDKEINQSTKKLDDLLNEL